MVCWMWEDLEKKNMLSEEGKGNCRCRGSERKDVFKDQKRMEGHWERRGWLQEKLER